MNKMSIAFALMLALPALAQTATPTPVDPALFQTSGFFRLSNGDFGTIPAQTRDFAILDPSSFKQVLDPLTGKPLIEKDHTYIYDARTPFAKIKVAGANYAVLADNTMIAFSATWDKPIPKGKLQFEVETYGGNFLIKKGTREVVTVSSTGYVQFFTTVIAPAVRLVGGNYFIDANNDLWTVDHKGFVYHLAGTQYPLARIPGGNYFYQQDGSIVTIGSNGLPQPAFVPSSKPIQLGGNYYVAEDGVIYTVRYDGISFQNGAVPGKIKHLGYSYAFCDDGRFFAVDGMGAVHVAAVRVSSTKNKYTKINQFSEAVDPVSVYAPNSRRN